MSSPVITAAQCVSRRGDVERNLATHLRFAAAAAEAGADLIVFPELSITGYEPDLAPSLQFEPDDPALDIVRAAAREFSLVIVAGAPLYATEGKPFLGAIVFTSDRDLCYAKVHVTPDEQAHFQCGDEHAVFDAGSLRFAPAICADTSHPSHAVAAAQNGAALYAAGVMMIEEDATGHAERMQRYASDCAMMTLSANYAGESGGLVSAGGSAIWDAQGQRVVQAPGNEPVLMLARREAEGWRGDSVDMQ